MARLGPRGVSAFDWRANVGEDVRYRARFAPGWRPVLTICDIGCALRQSFEAGFSPLSKYSFADTMLAPELGCGYAAT
jgi:hypothetical protein